MNSIGQLPISSVTVNQLNIQFGDFIKIYEQGKDREPQLAAVLIDASKIFYSDQELSRTKGYEILEFVIRKSHHGFKFIKPENFVELGGRSFNIKLIEELSYTGDTVKVTCYATWYRFALGKPQAYEGVYVNHNTFTKELASRFPGPVPVPEASSAVMRDPMRKMTMPYNTPLYWMRYISKLYDYKWVFGAGTTFIPPTGLMKSSEFNISYDTPLQVGMNTIGIKRTIDSTKLVNSYYLTGKDGQKWIGPGNTDIYRDISWSHSQNFKDSYYLKVKSDERFTDNDSMTTEMSNQVKMYGAPLISYEVSVRLLNNIPILGGKVLVLDEEYEINEWRKVTERKIDYLFPEKSTITFEDPRQDLIDLLNEEAEVI